MCYQYVAACVGGLLRGRDEYSSPSTRALHPIALPLADGLRNGEAIIAAVQAAIAAWPQHADAAGLSRKAAKLVGDRIAPAVAKVAKPEGKATGASATPRSASRKGGR
jgi:hypothetical protein